MRRYSFAALMAALLCFLGLGLVSCKQLPKEPDGLYARFTTSKGTFVAKLEFEKAPMTVCNFAGLAEGKLGPVAGKHFFDGLVFHRVEPDFVIQGGDPDGADPAKAGSGGPGYQFPNEIVPELKYDSPGVLGMANSGPDTNGSQFFVTLKETPFLDGGYSVFGKVVEGMDVVKQIAKGDKMDKVEIIRQGSAAQAFKDDKAAFDATIATISEAAKKRAEDARKADIETIAKNWPDLKPGSDGIFQKVLTTGSGAVPAKGQSVKMSYKGMFLDGKVFDDSKLHGGFYQFKVGTGEVIPGWDLVVSTMKKGEKRFIVVPPELAFGSQGRGGVIPPNAYLAFEVELLDFVK